MNMELHEELKKFERSFVQEIKKKIVIGSFFIKKI